MSDDILPTMAHVTDRDGSWYKVRESDYQAAVDEIKRLREEAIDANHRYADLQQVCDDQDKQITSWIADRDSWIARYEAMRKEKDELEAIAIEERAVANFGGDQEGQDYHIEFANLPEEGEDGCVYSGIPSSKKGYRRQAAKELSLEVGYVAQLEDAFLKMYPLYTGATDDQAQAALVKIREGKCHEGTNGCD